VPRRHFVAIVLAVAVAITLVCTSSSSNRLGVGVGSTTLARAEIPAASASASPASSATAVAPRSNAETRGTIQLAQLEDQFEAVAHGLAPTVVAISASLTNIDSDEALRAESLNGDKLEAILNRTTRTVGTGFFIDPEGYILTNEHVVAEAGQMWVTTDDRKVYPAIVIGSDPRADMAILKIPARNMPTVKFAKPGTVHRGMWTIALGNPYGLAELGEMSMSVGIVSAIDRSLPKLSSKENRLYSNLIQTTAEINPGNSGGPLFDLAGQVIGINTAVILPQKQTNGIGFAIPITDELLRKIDDLKQGREIVYGYLGVMVSNPTARERRGAGVSEEIGVVIDSVENNSPAQNALKVGDYVCRIDGQPVRDSDHFVRVVGELPVNRATPIALRREGKTCTVEISTRKRQLPSVAVTRENQRFRWRGMLLGPIPANWDVGGKRPDKGVMVISLDPTSPAIKDGIQVGSVITSIAGRAVTDVIELQRVVNEIPPDQWRVELFGTPTGAMMAGGQ
jgi:serine protease Do